MEPEFSEIDQLIAKKFIGSLTHEEESRLAELIKDDAAAAAQVGHARAIWQTASTLKLREERDKSTRWNAIKSQTFPIDASKRVISFSQILRYAAVFSALAVVIFVWLSRQPSQLIEVRTARGETKQVTLPDNSIVQLNSETLIRYDASGWGDQRTVTLTGEAFFDVTKNKIPFVVESGNAHVTVLGTSFNIRTRDEKSVVMCFSGKVGVNKPGNDDTALLTKGMAVNVSRNALSEVYAIDQNDTPGWLNGELSFNDTPIAEVFDELERHFNKTVKYKGTNSTQTFTGSFNNADFNTVLNTVCLSAGLTFSVTADSTVVIK